MKTMLWASTLVAGVAAAAWGQNCAGTATGRVPLNDLGPGLYLGQFQGGLYPGGSNQPPTAHAAEGVARALAIAPLNAAGQPSASGKYVMVSVGMSNTTQEFCSQGSGEPCDPWTFMGRAANADGTDRAHLVIVNGARGGQAASAWDQPTDPEYDRVRDQVLAPRGLTEAQVQIGWVKQANPGPSASLPAANADAYQLTAQLGNIARAMKVRYPNLKIVFLSSRIYAGYATTALNPEPHAYEGGFAAKWVIEAQIAQMAGGPIDPRAGDLNHGTVAPWLAWGPYLWADGLTPRSDGLTWACNQFASDGTHPAPGPTGARSRVGQLLHEFFSTSPFSTPWFLAGAAGCYPNCDGSIAPPAINVADFSCFLQQYAAGRTYANCDGSAGSPMLNVSDFGCFLQRYATGCP
ncbi:MAG: hypothetical protein WD749_14605 [Phycisphaerales bacterium]